MWETGQREWVVHLIREKRLPAELQRGGSSHEQARLLSHQEATIRRTKMGQLPFDDKEPIKTPPVTESPTSHPTGGTEHPNFHTCLVREQKEIPHSVGTVLTIQS